MKCAERSSVAPLNPIKSELPAGFERTMRILSQRRITALVLSKFLIRTSIRVSTRRQFWARMKHHSQRGCKSCWRMRFGKFNLLILDRVEILPKYRGGGVGLLVLTALIERFGAGAGVVGM